LTTRFKLNNDACRRRILIVAMTTGLTLLLQLMSLVGEYTPHQLASAARNSSVQH